MPDITNFSGEFETGRVAVGDVTPVQLPEVPCKLVVLRSNASGGAIIGNSDAVTATTGFLVEATENSPPIPVDNLSQIWVIANVASHSLDFLAMR